MVVWPWFREEIPTMKVTKEQARENRARIIETAATLFRERGYDGVSVADLMAAAGFTHGGFYKHFGSKADLVIAAYEEHWKQRQPELDRIFSAQIPPLERLTRWCDSAYDRQKERAQKFGHVCGCPYASIGVEIATQDDKIRAKAEELIGRGTKYVETAIAEAQREGSLPEGDAPQLAQQVYSYVLGALLRAKIQNDVEVLRDLSPTVMAIIGAKRVEANTA